MNTAPRSPTRPLFDRRHRYPWELIRHALWLHHALDESFRSIAERFRTRGIDVTHETVRKWCRKFAKPCPNAIRRRAPRPGESWYIEQGEIAVGGRSVHIWRACGMDGYVLDVLVTGGSSLSEAKRFFRSVLIGMCYIPVEGLAEKLARYRARNGLQQLWPDGPYVKPEDFPDVARKAQAETADAAAAAPVRPG